MFIWKSTKMILVKQNRKIRRPLFRGAPRLRKWNPFPFQQLAVIGIQLAAYAFISLEGPKTRGSRSPDHFVEIWLFIKNRVVFTPVFKIRKTVSEASKKQLKCIKKITKKRCPRKAIFCNTFYAKQRF